MIIPRVGDRWEFYPTVGKKHKTIKTIISIDWIASPIDGKMRPWIDWSHVPKARRLGRVRVKYFLAKKAIRRLPPIRFREYPPSII